MKIIPFCASEYSTEHSTGQKYHHNHHHHHRRRRRRPRVAIMELGHLLTLSGLTHPKSRQWSSPVLSAFWCAVIFFIVLGNLFTCRIECLP
jgi:hypothetical protein